MAAVQVSLLQPGEEAEWDGFVTATPLGTFFHLSGWKDVIEKAFGHRTYYLMARRRGQICGVMPLTQIRSILFGNLLVSNAFCVHGGPVFEEEETQQILFDDAARLARHLRAGGVESRSEGISGHGWEQRSGTYANFRRPIAPTAEQNLRLIPRKQRAMIRKAGSFGLRAEIDTDAERLHRVYAASVHRLGTPVFSKRYFQLLKSRFGDACDILTVLHRDRPIASVMNFYFRNEVLPYYGGGTSEARDLAGNDFMYWEVMRRACERGVETFDFGRSKIGTGAYDFKHNWGFPAAPLTYAYLSLGARKVGELNPLNPRFRIAINLWRRLPLAVTKTIGPAIVRSLG